MVDRLAILAQPGFGVAVAAALARTATEVALTTVTDPLELESALVTPTALVVVCLSSLDRTAAGDAITTAQAAGVPALAISIRYPILYVGPVFASDERCFDCFADRALRHTVVEDHVDAIAAAQDTGPGRRVASGHNPVHANIAAGLVRGVVAGHPRLGDGDFLSFDVLGGATSRSTLVGRSGCARCDPRATEQLPHPVLLERAARTFAGWLDPGAGR